MRLPRMDMTSVSRSQGEICPPGKNLHPSMDYRNPSQSTPLNSWKFLKRYDFALLAVQQAHNDGAELLYTWSPQAALVGLWYKMPVILEIHDLPTGTLGPWLLRHFFRVDGSKRLLAITQALADKLKHVLGSDYQPEIVQIAPNGTDLSQYQDLPDPVIARQILALPEKFTVGYTGHFYKGRGTALLISLAKAFPEINFIWVGGNPGDIRYLEEQNLSKRISKM